MVRYRPPRPPGGKVIPFPTDRIQPSRVKDLPDIPTKLPFERINEKIERRKQEGMTPFPELPTKEEGLSGLGEEVPVKTDMEKYNDALREQQNPKDLSYLDDWMITDVSYLVPQLVKRKDLNKSTKELVSDLQYVIDYVDWITDYIKRGETFSMSVEKAENIDNFVMRLSDEIEKRMRDE